MSARVMPSQPFLSVLTPAYNAARFLPALAASVEQQCNKSFEHLVIDDGSQDDGATTNVLASLSSVRWYSRPNKGQYATQNELLSQATGEYVTVICADDCYANSHVFERVASLAATVRADVIFGDTEVLIDGTRPLTYCPYLRGRFAWSVLPLYPMVQHCSVFVRRDFLLEHNLVFNTAYRIRGDMDWLLRVHRAKPSVSYIGGTAAFWRSHEDQTSRDTRLGQTETEAIFEGRPIPLAVHAALLSAWRPVGRLAKARSVLRLCGWNGLRDAAFDWCVRQFSEKCQ